MSNKYLEKIAKNRELSKKEKAAVGGTAVVGGASLVHKEYHRGNLTGRETLYHGTSPIYKEQILKEGIKPNAKKGIIDIVQDATGKDLKSEGLTFMTRNKSDAKTYANQAERIRNNTFNAHDVMGRIKDMYFPSAASKKGVVTVNAPTWKNSEFKKVKNPELKTQFNSVNKDFQYVFLSKAQKKNLKKQMYDTFEKSVFTNKGSVSNKYIKGSSAYAKNSLGEISEFVKHNPKRFAKGLGKATAGVALIAGGSHLLKKTFTNGK